MAGSRDVWSGDRGPAERPPFQASWEAASAEQDEEGGAQEKGGGGFGNGEGEDSPRNGSSGVEGDGDAAGGVDGENYPSRSVAPKETAIGADGEGMESIGQAVLNGKGTRAWIEPDEVPRWVACPKKAARVGGEGR